MTCIIFLQRESFNVGVPLRNISGRPFYVGDAGQGTEANEVMKRIKSMGARIVIVLLNFDCYNAIKLACDSCRLTSQCIKWKNVERPPVRNE
jgi:hypothetical protein